jgi:DNA-directed RNA polymerase II subunit RPB3
MIPTIVKNYEDEEGLHFVLKDVHLSVANALRRTILSDIPTLVIRTENQKINQCTILNNTTRFHNEIVKQRISCIPIHTKDLDNFPKKYRLVINVKNEKQHEMRWVTCHDFQIQDKQNDQFIDNTELEKLFPIDPITNKPIDFLRLRPNMGPTIPGEHINLTADFSVATAKDNGMFNVVSKCAFHNSIDVDIRENLWSIQLQGLKDEGRSEEEIEFERNNFLNLDAYRCFKVNDKGEPNEFDFIVKTIGVYDNKEIVYNACKILEKWFHQFVHDVQSQIVPSHESIESRDLGYTSVTVSSIENSYDIILENEDYTIGYLLEHYLFTLFYENKDNDELTYVGFKKYHPHDSYSVIRMAFKKKETAQLLCSSYLVIAAKEIAKTIESVKNKFQ